MSEAKQNNIIQHVTDSVEFDFDEIEIVELENREEFQHLQQCEGGGGGGPALWTGSLSCS